MSIILNALLLFLANQFTSFICWPSREENKNAFPKCFQKFPNTVGIIDCTESAIEKPSLAKAQAQTYSGIHMLAEEYILALNQVLVILHN